MNWSKLLMIAMVIGLSLTLAGCGSSPTPNPTPTSTETGLVPLLIPGSITQIAWQRPDVAISPFADFLLKAQKDARIYWRLDASLRQIDVQYDKTTDKLGYELRFISLSKFVNGNPDTLTAYYNYDLPLVENGSLKKHQPTLAVTHRLAGLTCEQDSSCNPINYVGRAPLPINDIKLSFLESYALVADKIQLLDAQAGVPPYTYSLQVEAGLPQWIFYNWRVNATSGTVTSLSN